MPPASAPQANKPAPLSRLPRTVWVLGFASLFMDTSSEMIHGLLQVFLVGSLGLGALSLPVRTVFWIACIPAVITVCILLFGLREPAHVPKAPTRGNPFAGFRFGDYPAHFWRLVGLVLLFTLMRFSEAFLVLRASNA